MRENGNNWASNRLICFSFEDPELSIVEGEEKFIEVGSNLNLTCIIKQTSVKESLENVPLKWTHNDQVRGENEIIEMFSHSIKLNMIN